jgi:hypothetical protein
MKMIRFGKNMIKPAAAAMPTPAIALDALVKELR